MKITKTRLKQMIKEELSRMIEIETGEGEMGSRRPGGALSPDMPHTAVQGAKSGPAPEEEDPDYYETSLVSPAAVMTAIDMMVSKITTKPRYLAFLPKVLQLASRIQGGDAVLLHVFKGETAQTLAKKYGKKRPLDPT